MKLFSLFCVCLALSITSGCTMQQVRMPDGQVRYQAVGPLRDLSDAIDTPQGYVNGVPVYVADLLTGGLIGQSSVSAGRAERLRVTGRQAPATQKLDPNSVKCDANGKCIGQYIDQKPTVTPVTTVEDVLDRGGGGSDKSPYTCKGGGDQKVCRRK
jgi:hypothetical protein